MTYLKVFLSVMLSNFFASLENISLLNHSVIKTQTGTLHTSIQAVEGPLFKDQPDWSTMKYLPHAHGENDSELNQPNWSRAFPLSMKVRGETLLSQTSYHLSPPILARHSLLSRPQSQWPTDFHVQELACLHFLMSYWHTKTTCELKAKLNGRNKCYKNMYIYIYINYNRFMHDIDNQIYISIAKLISAHLNFPYSVQL